MYKVRMTAAAGLVALLLAVTASASASTTVDLKYVNVSPSQTVSIYWEPESGTVVHNWRKVYAGLYNWDARIDDVSQGRWGTYCVNLQQNTPPTDQWLRYTVQHLEDAPLGEAHYGSNDWTVPMGAETADELRRIYDYVWGENIGTPSSAQHQAAFQLAVWEIIYDTDRDLSTGDFQATAPAGTIALANTWLTASATWEGSADLYGLTNPDWQDVAVLKGTYQIHPVPLPAAAWSGLALLGGVGAAGRIRRRLLG